MENNTGDRNTGNWNTGNCNTGDRNTGNWNTGDWNTGNCNTGDFNTGDWNTGDCNTGDFNTGDWNTGDRNTGNCNTGDRNTGNCNTGDWNTGDGNTGNCNTGDWNTGYWNTGLFNTDEPYMRCFNKETTIKRSDFNGMPSFYDFNLNYWIKEDNMTDQEKKENPTYKTTGGFLKSVDYKTAWRAFWDTTDEENKQKFLKLPNFDAEIFKEVTGIDLKRKSTITIDGKEFDIETLKNAIANSGL